MEITSAQLKELREKSRYFSYAVQTVLTEAGGDMEKAIIILKKA